MASRSQAGCPHAPLWGLLSRRGGGGGAGGPRGPVAGGLGCGPPDEPEIALTVPRRAVAPPPLARAKCSGGAGGGG